MYCGHQGGPREDTPATMADVLKAHIEVCPEHPLSHAKAEIERLEAIVDKLPKCWRLVENGKLVRDVPAVPGMDAWHREPDTETLMRFGPLAWRVRGIEREWLRVGRVDGLGADRLLPVIDFYDTKEAAEAARGK